MRLIDADALFKDICDSINEMTKIRIMVDGQWLWAKLNDALENAPTIEPYTLCKDCIYHEDDEAENYEYCTEWQRETHGDWLCSRGANNE